MRMLQGGTPASTAGPVPNCTPGSKSPGLLTERQSQLIAMVAVTPLNALPPAQEQYTQ